jgi:oligopeptide transport system substrate-binding protein
MRRSRRSMFAVMAVLVVGFAVVAIAAGCGGAAGGTGGASPGNPSPSGSPQYGGSLTIVFQSEPETLDPAIAWDLTGTTIEQSVFNSLLAYAPKPGMPGTELIPSLATEVPQPTNGGTTYTFHLRQGVMFHPPVSREMTADDVKYSFERMMKLPRAPATYFYVGVKGAEEFQAGKAEEISGVKVIDKYTIEFDLTEPDPAFLNAYTMWFGYVVAKEWVQKWGNRQIARHPLGTGPFIFDHWTPGREVVLKKNPEYWDAGKPYLDGLKFQFSLTPTTAYLKLKRGEVDVLGDNIPPAEVQRTLVDPQWKDQVQTMEMIAGVYLSMNTQFKPLDDVNVRQALSWAINREKLCKLQGGQAVPLWQFYPTGMPGSEPGKVYYGYDPAKAKQLLAEAGYPDGFTTELYTHNVDPFPKIAQSIQNDLKAVGVKASVKQLDRDTFYTLQATPHKTPLSTAEWYMDFPDPSDYVIPLASKSNAVEGGVDTAFWWDPRVEKMINDARSLTGQPRYDTYTQMAQIIMDNAPYVTLYQPLMTTMCSKNTGGFYLNLIYWFDTSNYWRIQ